MDGCESDLSNGATADSHTNWRQTEDENQCFDIQQDEDCEVEFCCTLPASCNWYSSSIVACYNGYCAYAGKTSVYIMKLHQHPPRFEWDMNVTPKINLKVTALAIISTQPVDAVTPCFPEYIAVGIEDGMSRLLNTSTRSVLKEHRSHKGKITAMSWSRATERILLAGDAKGNVSVWDYENNSVQLWTPVPSPVLCLQMSPLRKSLFVVGYGNGNIVVGDSTQLTMLTTFKSHNDDVTSLSWCPVLHKGKDYFASASKDRTVRLWETTAERSTAVLTPPRNNSRGKKDNKGNFHQVVLWCSGSCIISTTQHGDLVCWDDNGNSNTIGGGHDRIIFTMCQDPTTKQLVSVSMDRQMIVWNGSSVPRPVFKIPSFGGFVYSISTSLNNPYTVVMGIGDNTIRVSSTNDSSPGYDFTTLWDGIKSKVTVLALHPTYEGVIGFATEDGHVGCTSVTTRKTDISSTYHRKCVYSLNWGPQHSSKQGDEAKEVRVNCLYTVGGEGTLLMHKLGALNKDAHDVGKVIKIRNNLTIAPSRSDVAWNIDYTSFALGNSDGTIDIVTRDLVMICRVSAHKKMVNTLAWHHDYSYSDTTISYSNWLASGSNEDVICITDLSDTIRNFMSKINDIESQTVLDTQTECKEETLPEITCTSEGDPQFSNEGESDPLQSTMDPSQVTSQPEVLRPSKQLFGHSSRITRVAWNPHKNGILASASYDGHVRIWDVESAATLANFTGHIGRVYSVAWSFLTNDIVYSGGEDFTLRRWNISTLSADSNTASKRKKKTKKKKSDYAKDAADADNGENNGDSVNALDKGDGDEKRKSDLNVVLAKIPENVNREPIPCEKPSPMPNVSVNIVPRQPPSDKRPKRKVRSLLKKASAADGRTKEGLQQDCVDLARYMQAHSEDETTCKQKTGIDPTTEEYIHLAPYTTREDAYTFLANEIQGHEASQTQEPKFFLEIWRNNIGGALDKAVESSTLNEHLVALAPLGGYEMWRAAVLAYAQQLEQQQKIHMSVSYYLAAGESLKAIHLLRDNGFLKQALVLAKVQLGSKHPLVKEINVYRAHKLMKECQFEHAAQSFLAAGDIDAAISAAAKRGDSSSLLTSLKIADVYGMEKHVSYLLPQTLSSLYKEHKWSLLHELLPRCQSIELIHFKTVIGEYLAEHLYETDFVQNLYFAVENHKKHKYLTSDQDQKATTVEQQQQQQLLSQELLSHQQHTFLPKVLDKLDQHCKFSKQTCHQMTEHIDFHGVRKTHGKNTSVSAQDLWNDTIDSVLSGIIYLLNSDTTNAFKQWLALLNILHCAGYPYTVLMLYRLLLPRDKISFDYVLALLNSSDDFSSSLLSHSAFSNFSAFRCSCILHHLWYRMNENLSTEQDEKPAETDAVEDICESVERISINNAAISTCRENKEYCRRENLYFTLTWLSSILLSSVQTTYSSLHAELKGVEEQLLECDIKKRLNEHILARKHGGKSKTNDGGKEMDDEAVVQELCKGMVDVAVKVETSGHAGTRSTSMHQGQRENDLMTFYLKGREKLLSEVMTSHPPEVVEFAFPDTSVSYQIIVMLCSMFKSTDKRLATLLQDVLAWGDVHAMKLSPYVLSLVEKK